MSGRVGDHERPRLPTLVALLLAAAAIGTAPAGLGCGVAPRPVGLADADLPAAMRTAAAAVSDTWIRTHRATDVPWNWGEGVLVFGLQTVAETFALQAAERYVDAYLSHHAARGVEVRWSDDTTPALAAAARWARGDDRHRALVEQVVAYVERAPRSQPRGLLLHLGEARLPVVKALFPDAWVDSVFHVVPTLMRHADASGRSASRAFALDQLGRFAAALQDPRTGLTTHAFDDGEGGGPVPAFAEGLFWARGNGWLLASLVDALERLPAEHPARAVLLARTRALATALVASQDRSGLFHTVLLDRKSYLETAGSALILYGLSRGARLGLLDGRARAAALRGGRGLLGMLRQGKRGTIVSGTSLGTNPVPNLYARTPTADQVSYGVGAFLLAASELGRLDLTPLANRPDGAGTRIGRVPKRAPRRP